MAYDRIPGVDSNGNFPPEVVNALLNSPEIQKLRDEVDQLKEQLIVTRGMASSALSRTK